MLVLLEVMSRDSGSYSYNRLNQDINKHRNLKGILLLYNYIENQAAELRK